MQLCQFLVIGSSEATLWGYIHNNGHMSSGTVSLIFQFVLQSGIMMKMLQNFIIYRQMIDDLGINSGN